MLVFLSWPPTFTLLWRNTGLVIKFSCVLQISVVCGFPSSKKNNFNDLFKS